MCIYRDSVIVEISQLVGLARLIRRENELQMVRDISSVYDRGGKQSHQACDLSTAHRTHHLRKHIPHTAHATHLPHHF